MQKSSLMLLFTSLVLTVACGQISKSGTSTPMSLIGQYDAADVCSSAGETYLPLASLYNISFVKSGDGPTYFTSDGVFSFDAPFDYGERKVVEAHASNMDTLYAESGKILRIRLTGGIANRKHDTENFKLYMGSKVDGVDSLDEMEWHQSPTTTYTAYTLDYMAPQVSDQKIEIWFEAKFTENGVDKILYESHNGQNYKINVAQDNGKSICFDANWREGLKGGDLKSGESVTLVYDVKRLLARMMGTTYSGWPAWNAYAHFKVLDAFGNVIESGRLPITASANDPANGRPSTVRPSYKPLLPIPATAKDGKLVFWFEGPNRGPTVWDSDFNLNYEVSIK
jgi:hypothetical protein